MALAELPVSNPINPAWMARANCRGQTHLFFSPPGERPETRELREARAKALCLPCDSRDECRTAARENREYGLWGGESEEDRAAAGFRVDMPVGRIARYPKGDGTPVQPRLPGASRRGASRGEISAKIA